MGGDHREAVPTLTVRDRAVALGADDIVVAQGSLEDVAVRASDADPLSFLHRRLAAQLLDLLERVGVPLLQRSEVLLEAADLGGEAAVLGGEVGYGPGRSARSVTTDWLQSRVLEDSDLS